jgi:hypothetical protein
MQAQPVHGGISIKGGGRAEIPGGNPLAGRQVESGQWQPQSCVRAAAAR